MSVKSALLYLLRKTVPSALLLLVSRRSIFKLVLTAYLLLELLPNDVTRRCTAAAGATSTSENESNELINGKVIRVLVFNVNDQLLIVGLSPIITFYLPFKFSLKLYNFLY